MRPAGRTQTWAALGEIILKICKHDKSSWETGTPGADPMNMGEEMFLYRVLDVIDALPKPLDYKTTDDKIVYDDARDIAGHFVLCAHCWRAVARRPRERKTPLCHVHDLPGTAPEYRKRERMRKKTQVIKQFLKAYLPSPNNVRCDLTPRPDVYLLGLCRDADSQLPNLVRYLRSLKVPLRYGEDIIRALEEPIYWDKLDPQMIDAWKFHFADRGTYFEQNYEKLLWAEAWLYMEKAYMHGGRRE
jgi:hypothetical protein